MKNFNQNLLADSLWVAKINEQYLIFLFIESTNQYSNLTLSLYRTNSNGESIQNLGNADVFVNETLNNRIHEFYFLNSIYKIILAEDFTRILGSSVWFIPSGVRFGDFRTAINRYHYFN
jgi:hypothetical protein